MTAPRSEKLSLWTKVAYALGEVGTATGPGTIVPFWYLFFLTNVAKLDPALAGLSVLIGKVWDAVNDPLVGLLSDRTRTRWGRRRPYLLFGAVPFGATFALLWIVPPIQDQLLLCLYFAGVYILFDTAVTLVGCPYGALTPELTLDHDERTSLLTYRMAVSIASGLLVAILLGEVIFPRFAGNELLAFRAMGVVCGALFVVPLWITFLGTRERAEFQAQEPLRPLAALRHVLRNREWRYYLAMDLLGWLPVDIVAAVFPFYLVYWIGMSEGDSNLLIAVILFSAVLFLPLVRWLAQRLEKKTAFMIATASWAVLMLAILAVPRGEATAPYVIAALAGLGVASAHLLPSSMGADVLEVDELMSGKRQEGVYSGFSVFVRKLSTALVVGLIGPVLALTGYQEAAQVQPTAALTALRVLITVVPALLLAGACIVAWRYPLTRARHAEILRELALRSAAGE